ncbi:hypothetical protein [Methylibium sp.]|jgi:hypothetical protein|uniref:hypothetical protein n=1 Tax=Methylibium sp. TaxID=2067992 RepID=UPI003D122CBB
MSTRQQRWDLKQFRKDVEALFGRDQVALLNPCLASLHDRREFARMQYQEAERLCQDFMADRVEDEDAVMLLALGASDDSGEFVHTTKRAEGHMVAFLESLYAMSDTLGHVIYFGLGANLDGATRLPERKVSLWTVANQLEGRSAVAGLAHAVNALTSHKDYVYAAALTNHCKHRSVVGVPYTFNLVPREKGGYLHGLQFKHFRYGQEVYPPRWVSDVMPQEYVRQTRLVVKIGNELNGALAKRIRETG